MYVVVAAAEFDNNLKIYFNSIKNVWNLTKCEIKKNTHTKIY